MSEAYFTTDDGRWFVGTELTRGPWDPDSCHAGPPTGLVARAAERALVAQRLVRLTVSLQRPVPLAGFSVEAEVTRQGRSVSSSIIRIIDGDGRECVHASGLHLSAAPVDESMPTAEMPTPDLAEARPGGFPVGVAPHGLPWFSKSAEMRYPPGEDSSPGPTTTWMRTVPLLADEEPSPFQRICPLADCGNAIGRNAEPDLISFINPDLTIVLHRPPEGEWLGSYSVSHWQPDGIGLADAWLFDATGPVGRACQTLLVRRNQNSAA